MSFQCQETPCWSFLLSRYWYVKWQAVALQHQNFGLQEQVASFAVALQHQNFALQEQAEQNVALQLEVIRRTYTLEQEKGQLWREVQRLRPSDR